VCREKLRNYRGVAVLRKPACTGWFLQSALDGKFAGVSKGCVDTHTGVKIP
jgi:hypothetical protein